MRAGPWKNNGCGFQGLEKRAGDLAADRAGLNNMATIDNHPKFFEDIACRNQTPCVHEMLETLSIKNV